MFKCEIIAKRTENGSQLVRCQYPSPAGGKFPMHRKTMAFWSEPDAHKYVSEQRRLSTGNLSDERITLSEFAELYNCDMANRWTAVERQQVASVLFGDKMKDIADMEITRITADDIITWMSFLADDISANKMTKDECFACMNNLRLLFKHAVEYYSLPLNPEVEAERYICGGKIGDPKNEYMRYRISQSPDDVLEPHVDMILLGHLQAVLPLPTDKNAIYGDNPIPGCKREPVADEADAEDSNNTSNQESTSNIPVATQSDSQSKNMESESDNMKSTRSTKKSKMEKKAGRAKKKEKRVTSPLPKRDWQSDVTGSYYQDMTAVLNSDDNDEQEEEMETASLTENDVSATDTSSSEESKSSADTGTSTSKMSSPASIGSSAILKKKISFFEHNSSVADDESSSTNVDGTADSEYKLSPDDADKAHGDRDEHPIAEEHEDVKPITPPVNQHYETETNGVATDTEASASQAESGETREADGQQTMQDQANDGSAPSTVTAVDNNYNVPQIHVLNQAELDRIPSGYDGRILIDSSWEGAEGEPIVCNRSYPFAVFVLKGSEGTGRIIFHTYAYGHGDDATGKDITRVTCDTGTVVYASANDYVTLCGNAKGYIHGNATVYVNDAATAYVKDNATAISLGDTSSKIIASNSARVIAISTKATVIAAGNTLLTMMDMDRNPGDRSFRERDFLFLNKTVSVADQFGCLYKSTHPSFSSMLIDNDDAVVPATRIETRTRVSAEQTVEGERKVASSPLQINQQVVQDAWKVTPSHSCQAKTSVDSGTTVTSDKMKARAREGFFVRDAEADCVYCPGGATLHRKITRTDGRARYYDKGICNHCIYRNRCVTGTKHAWHEVNFREGDSERKATWWDKVC